MTSLRQLEYLVTVVDTGSFTRAAEQLHVTQPALSHQMRALEQSLGGPLLERLPRTVRLTPMGRAMLPHARAALADAERARCAARLASGTTAGELQVATVYSVSLGVLPPALRVWRRDRPDVDVRLIEFRHADELREAMTAGEADVALGPLPSAWPGPVRTLGVEEFVVVLPADGASEDDAAGVVDLATLAGCAWVHYAPGNGLAELVDAACAAAGFRPRAAVRTEQTAAAPILAAAGLGPALVPANVLPARFDGRVLRPATAVRRTVAAYTRAAPDPLAAAFIETLVEHAAV
jgi:DNA-binding transcriptional LysR family regulator